MNVPKPPSSLWKNVGELVKDTIGPMAILALGAQKFAEATLGAVLNAEKLQAALAASSGAETLRVQFEGLGDSAEQARAKVDMLAQASANGPFDMASLGEAAKNLQAVGGAGMVTQKMLKQVQDVAAATGSPVDAVATAVANLNQQLQSGGDATQAASQLAGLGAISQATAQKVAQLAASGAPAADSLRVLGAELGNAAGASDKLASTLGGLEAQLANLQNANNISIGDLFIEGEKAGKRAAIGFEKVRGAIDEVASGPIATIVNGFQSLKEAIANLASSEGGISAIKGLFVVLSSSSIAILAVVIAQLLKLGGTLLMVAGSAVKASGALTLLGAAGGRFMGWLNTATGRMSALAAGLSMIAVKAFQVRDAINASTKAIQDLSTSNARQMGGFAKAQVKIETPEDRQAAVGNIDQAILENDDALNNAIKERDAVRNKSRFGSGTAIGAGGAALTGAVIGQLAIPIPGVGAAIGAGAGLALGAGVGGFMDSAEYDAELNQKEDAVDQIRRQGGSLRNRRKGIAQTKVGMDQKQYQQAITADSFQGSVRRGAMERLQGLSSPDTAVKLAESELSVASEKQVTAQAASRASYGENENLYKAQQGIISSRQGVNQATDELKIAQEDGDDGATEAAGEKRREAVKKFEEAFKELENLKPETGSGKLSKDLAIRENLRDEKAQALEDQASGRGGDQLNAINARIEALGGQEAISGPAIQDLRKRRDQAMEGEDPVKAAEYKEEMAMRVQAAKVAQAAAAGEVKASKERLALEAKISALKGGGKAAALKASDLEYQNEASAIGKRSEAVAEKEASGAEPRYMAALQAAQAAKLGDDPDNDTAAQKQIRLTLEDARREWERVQTVAAEAGVQAGDTAESLKLAQERATQRKEERDQSIAEQSVTQKGQLNRDRGAAGRARAGRGDSALERAAGSVAEGGARVINIMRAEQAAKELESAQGAVKNPKSLTKEETDRINNAKTNLAATGFGGMGVDEIAQIKAAEIEILELKRQQAEVDFASAAARKQAAMEEVKFQQMRDQITVAGALGKTAGSEFDVREKELQNDRAKAEKAVPIAQQKEVLSAQAVGLKTAAEDLRARGDEKGAAVLDAQAEALIRKRDELEKALAQLGFAGVSSDDIAAQVAQINAALGTNQADRLVATQDMAKDKQIKAARIAEEYAPTAKARDTATQNRKKLEDDKFYQDALKGYNAADIKGPEAERLARNDTKMNRLQSDLDEAGTPEVDDLTRMGGNAAKTGLFPNGTQDKQEQLRDLAEQQAGLLAEILAQNSKALGLAESELRNGK
jgi:hypothetical protein